MINDTSTLKPRRVITARRRRISLMEAGKAVIAHHLGRMPRPELFLDYQRGDLSCFGVYNSAVVPSSLAINRLWENPNATISEEDQARSLFSFGGQAAVHLGLGDPVPEEGIVLLNYSGNRFRCSIPHKDCLVRLWAAAVQVIKRNWLAVDNAREERERLYRADVFNAERLGQAMHSNLVRSFQQLTPTPVSP